MNPARSLASALVSGNFQHLWIYLVATVLGAVLAVPLFALTHRSALEEPPNPASAAPACQATPMMGED
jgi:ABC-type proline/glycine betaine transport system permease subunit